MKKKILFTFDSRRIEEIFKPLILKLSKDFKIVILAHDVCSPRGIVDLLNSWKKEGIIERYTLVPDPHYSNKGLIKRHLLIKNEIKALKPYKFDFWLTVSEMQVLERYISECILPRYCKRVILWTNITYLLDNQSSGKWLASGRMAKNKDSFFKKVCNKLRVVIIEKKPRLLIDYFMRAWEKTFLNTFSKFYYHYCDRLILPFFLSGKYFRYGRYDQITQIGSGRSDILIFCDDLEAAAHKKLLKTTGVYTAQYPTYGNCRCQLDKNGKNTILSPLSGFLGFNSISDSDLMFFLRDFKSAILYSGAKRIHLRAHPDEKGKWPFQLRDFLVKSGIDAVIVGSHNPISKVACDYLGVVGCATGALRDARASCSHIFVVGSVVLSKVRYLDPKFVFGRSEGIGWIEEDGSCDPAIFTRKKFEPVSNITVEGILRQLSQGLI